MAMTFEQYISDKKKREPEQTWQKVTFEQYVQQPQQTGSRISYVSQPESDPLMSLAMETVSGDNHDRYHAAQKSGIGTFRPGYGYGNINLNDRPMYKNPDGSISTVDSFSTNIDGREVLLPQIGRDARGNAVRWTEDQAIDNYLKTGENLGTFSTVDDANAYAEWLHNQQAGDLEKRRNDLVTQIKVTDKKIDAAKRDANTRTTMQERANLSGLANTAAREEAQAYMNDRYAKVKELQEQRASLMDQLHAAGGKYGVGDFVGDALNALQAGLQTPLTTLEKADYWLSEKLGLVDRNDENEYARAHALENDIAQQAEAAMSGRNDIGRAAIGAFQSAGNVLGSSAFAYATGIPQGAQQILGPVAANLSATEAGLGANAGQRAIAGASRFAGNLLGDVVANPTNAVISAQSGIGAYDRAKTAGASDGKAFAAGIANAAAEYLSNKMFSGTPLLDSPEEKGYVVELIESAAEKAGRSAQVQALFGNGLVSFVFDKSGEGLEEVITGVLDPLIEKLTYNPNADLATASDLFDEYIGGVAMSLLLGAAEPVTNFQGRKTEARAVDAARAAANAGMGGMTLENAAREIQRSGNNANIEDLRPFYDRGVQTLNDAAKTFGVETDGKSGPQIRSAVDAAMDAEIEKARRAPLSKMDVLNMIIDENGKMGENGAKYAREMYRVAQSDDVSTTDWFAGFNSIYQAGRNGTPIEDVQNRYADTLSPQVRKAAYNAGQEDAILAAPEQAPRFTFDIRQTEDGKYAVDVTDTQTGKTSSGGVFDTMETAEKVVGDFKAQTGGIVNEQNGNESEEWNAGVPGREERGGLRGRAEEIEQRRETGKLRAESIRNSVAAAEGGEKVSSRDAGISGGTDTASMHIVRQYEDDDMRAIRQDAKKRGVNVVFFTGEIEAKKGKKIIKARGEYSTDGKTLYVALDDPDFTARQIYDHEEFHARAHTDAELQQVCEDIINSHSAAELEEMVRAYVNAYGWTDMTNEEIMQEILADAYAGIDIFNYLSGFEGATMFTEAVRNAVQQREGEQQKERGPPAEGIESEEAGGAYSQKVTDRDMLQRLNTAEREGVRDFDDITAGDKRGVVKVYRAMQAQPVGEDGNVIPNASVRRIVSYDPLVVEAKVFRGTGKNRIAEIITAPAKLFSPMAGQYRGVWRNPIELGAWEMSEGHLERATTQIDKKTGQPKIDTDKKNASYGETAYYYGLEKGGVDDNGKPLTDVPARYNPYSHTSLSALNDQFSSAEKRPELVTVESLVPVWHINNGENNERLPGAKDRVGAMSWHSGPTSSRLAKIGKPRTVILTRYDKPIRVVPDAEVAKSIAKTIGDSKNVAIQGSTVTPSLAKELKALGVSVLNAEEWADYVEKNPVKTFGETIKSARFSQKITPQQDADYSAAVERGDMETAQKMVDEAAKAAGYTTPKLYHGTRAFGFTAFDTSKSDDGISLFATDNPKTAETYSGTTQRNRIKDRSTRNADNLHGEELVAEAKEYIKRYQDYKLMSAKDRETVTESARESVQWSIRRAQEFVRDHNGAFDSDKELIMDRLIAALYDLKFSETEDDIKTAWDAWEDAIWDLKGIDDSLAIEFLDDVDSRGLFQCKNELDDMTYSGDIYADWYVGGPDYVFDNQLMLELNAEWHKGIYELYGKPGKQLVIEADGTNWNQITPPEELMLSGPQRTRDIAKAAKALGYDSILFKGLRDNGGETAYNGESNVYIFFRPDALKSSDPVTYDDNGNVIPLSERFNPENEDIRYSQKLTAEDELRRQNEDLQKRVEYWKGQTKRTTVPTARAEDAAKMGRQVVKDYDSEADAKEIGAALKDLADYIMRGENVAYAEVKDRAVTIARELVENAKTLREGDGETFREVRDALQKPLIISAQDAHDVTPDGWGKYRDSIRGKVNVSINGKGTPVDVAYAELSDRFPSLFPAEITHPADQLQQMVDVVSELAPVYENPFSYNMAEAIEYAANDIIDRVLGEDIRQTPPTFADKAAARLDAEKARGAEKLAQERERSKQKIADIKSRNAWATAQRIAEVRKQRDAKIVAIKEHYAEAKKTASERKADSAMRTRLLKIAKRLQNKKLPAVSRALLEQYIGNLDTVAKSITGNTVMDLNRLRNWYDDQKANNPDFIADAATEAKIARLSKTQISDLTPAQVAELTEVLLNFENEINTQRRMIDSEDKRDTRQMVLESLYNVEETKGSKKTAVDWIVTNTLSPERLIKRLTGYAETDPLLMRTRELADGQRKMFDYQRRAEARFSRWANDKKLMDRLRSKERVKITGYSHGRAVEVEITPDMRMALYLHSLNDENMKHIANGGVTIPDIDTYLKGDIGEAYSRGKTVKLSPSNIRSIVASMSAEERAYAQAAHDYFNGMSKDEINDVSEKLVGYSIAGVDDYFPIETDKNFTKSDIAELKRDGTIEGMGFLKERQHASNAIYLVPLTDVLNKSIQNHAKYVGMAIPVRNFSKIWGMNAHNDAAGEDNGLRQAIGHSWGERGIQAVERIISDVQNPSRSEDGKLLAKIRSNYAAAVLTLNASVALKQAASYPTAAAVLGWEPLIKAMGNVGKVNLDLINKYTPLQWYRSKGYSTQELGDIRSKGGVMDKVLSASIKTKDGREIPLLNWIQGIDLATTRKLWKASEYYVQQHNADLQRGSDAYYKAVADIYNKTIEQTQPNYTTMQRPQILRSSNQLLQSLVMFKTQPFQNFNILYDAVGELRAAERAAKNGDSSRLTQAKKNAVNAVSSNLVSAVVFAAMTMAWAYARRKKDKYEDKEGNFNPWKQIGKDVLSSEFGMIPFGSDAYNLLSSWVFGEKYYGMSNITADSISGALDATKKAVDTLSKTVSALLDGDETTTADPETVAKELFDCAKDLSKIAGIPLENVVNLVTAVYTNVAASVNGEYVTGYEILRNTKNMDSSYNKSAAYDILYKAKQQDSEQYNELRKMMIEDGFKEKNIDSAMTKRAEKK